MDRTVAQLKPYRSSWRLYLLLASLLTSLTASCAHQPWDINRYIHALERPQRDQYQQPVKVIETLNLTPGMVVADIGAGSGYFTRRLAEAVGDTGQVIAIDVEQKMLDYNKEKLEQLGLVKRVRFILAKPDSPSLSKQSVNLVFLCDVYHHLKHQVEYLVKTRSALTPNGRVVIIDYYADERSGHTWLFQTAPCFKRTSHQGYGTSGVYPIQRTHLPLPPIFPRICSKETK